MNHIRNIRGIAAYLIPSVLLILFRFTFSTYICDDAYITLKSAFNLADGKGLNFNQYGNVFIVTTTLWAFLLALLKTLGIDILLAVKILGIVFELAFLIATVYLGFVITGSRKIGLILAILMCTHPVYLFNSFGGMEISLFLFIVALSFIFLATGKPIPSLFFAALSIWARFDGIIVFLIILILAKPKSVKFIWCLAPIIAYVIFGYAQYGEIIPNSVKAKSLMSPEIFSGEWFYGAYKLIRQIGNALIMGRSTYWFKETTPYWIMTIMAFVGLFKTIKSKNFKTVALLLYMVIYSLGLAASGNINASYYPWYFTPPLLGFYLLSAIGVERVSSWIAKSFKSFKDQNLTSAAIVLMIVIIWVVAMIGPLRKDELNLYELEHKREGIYKAGAIWAGRYLPQNSTIAAYEIGAIGFYSRSDIKIIDTYGILRKKEDRGLDAIELLKKYNPELILVAEENECREIVESGMPDDYIWHKYKNLDIGIREDLNPVLQPTLNELLEIDFSNSF